MGSCHIGTGHCFTYDSLSMNTESDIYYTVKSAARGEFKDKGSKFLSFIFPVENEAEIQLIQKDLRKQYYDARHHVYAYRLGADGQTMKSSDDGEPANSSGPPVLGQIRSSNLTQVLIVVVRYFGGTKLGIPGLINAYKNAAKDAIDNCTIIEKTIEDFLQISFEYAHTNEVMRVVKTENCRIVQQFADDICRLQIAIPKSKYASVVSRFELLRKVTINTP